MLINLEKEAQGLYCAGDLEMITDHNVFQLPSRSSRTKRHYKQCDCPRKRGKRARIRAKLTQLAPKAIPLSRLLLANVRSQENKMDEIRLRLTQQLRDCGIHIFTETWLHHNIPNKAIVLKRWTVFCADRTQDVTQREVDFVFTSIMLDGQT